LTYNKAVMDNRRNFYFLEQQPSWMEGGSVGHKFERDPPKDHPCQVWSKSVQWFQRRRWKYEKFTDDDGHKVMTKAHMALWARWAKN